MRRSFSWAVEGMLCSVLRLVVVIALFAGTAGTGCSHTALRSSPKRSIASIDSWKCHVRAERGVLYTQVGPHREFVSRSTKDSCASREGEEQCSGPVYCRPQLGDGEIARFQCRLTAADGGEERAASYVATVMDAEEGVEAALSACIEQEPYANCARERVACAPLE